MTKKEFIDLWRRVTGNSHFSGKYWQEFREEIKQGIYDGSHMINWKELRQMSQWNQQYYIDTPPRCLASTETKPGPYEITYVDLMINPPVCVPAQEGITPMFKTASSFNTPVSAGSDLTINLAPAASASVATKSDVAIQRDYLMGQWKEINRSFNSYGSISSMLRKTFNLDADNTPRTSRALIDAIKGGKYKLDERIADLQDRGLSYDAAMDDDYIGGAWAAIEFDGPTPDRDGFDAACVEFSKLLKDAERTIIVKSPDDGLAALIALEAWKPTGKAN